METPAPPVLPHAAWLLLGPTGAGKTPLGDTIERLGLWGRTWAHFDFGANLRRLVERNVPDDDVSRADLDYLRQVLAGGALLRDDDFPLARRVLLAFHHRRRLAAETGWILNGLPRHAGQARALEAVVRIEGVILLECSPGTVVARIRSDVGGDRAGRADDALEAVRAKLVLYEKETRPLVEHYRAAGASIVALDVTAGMTAEEAYGALAGRA